MCSHAGHGNELLSLPLSFILAGFIPYKLNKNSFDLQTKYKAFGIFFPCIRREWGSISHLGGGTSPE